MQIPLPTVQNPVGIKMVIVMMKIISLIVALMEVIAVEIRETLITVLFVNVWIMLMQT